MKRLARYAALVLLLTTACSSSNDTSNEVDPDSLDFIFIDGPTLKAAKVGDTVTLDASHSYSTVKNQLTYTWSEQSIPASSSASLSDMNSPAPSFSADLAGTYTYQLTVSDANTSTSENFEIFVTDNSTNAFAIAKAGPDQHIKVGTQTKLDGSHSIDSDGNPLTYSWSMTSSPSGSASTLSSLTDAQPTFIPDVAGDYVFDLVVHDGTLDSTNTAQTTIFVTPRATSTSTPSDHNAKPIAHAGIDQTVEAHHLVTLNGITSVDSDGDTLSYSWHLSHKPNGSTVLVDAIIAQPTFSPDLAGVYVIKLVVNDGTIDSDQDSVTITATTPQHSTSPIQQLVSFGLDSTDAHYLQQNHPTEVANVLAKANKIFDGITITDGMFKPETDPDANGFSDTQMTQWTAAYKTRFKKIFGRIKFVVNTTHFDTAFSSQYSTLVSDVHEGDPTFWKPYPADLAGYKTDFADSISTGNGAFKFFVSNRTSGVAYGAPGLKLKVEAKMLQDNVPMGNGVLSPTPINDSSALIFHELNHSIGYDHAGQTPDQSDVVLKPNNIPYFVQIIIGYEADNIVSNYCQSNQISCAYNLMWGNPNSLLTIFFGQS